MYMINVQASLTGGGDLLTQDGSETLMKTKWAGIASESGRKIANITFIWVAPGVQTMEEQH